MGNNTAVLEAVKTMLTGGAGLGDVYIYPDDYTAMPTRLKFPFTVVEELPATTNTAAASVGGNRWTLVIYGMIADGTLKMPSRPEATARAAIFEARDTVAGILRADRTLGGTVLMTGDGDTLFTHSITALQWDQDTVLGFRFLIPVSQPVTGGC